MKERPGFQFRLVALFLVFSPGHFPSTTSCPFGESAVQENNHDIIFQTRRRTLRPRFDLRHTIRLRRTNFFWTGAVDQDWTNGGNWTPPGPPGTADNAHIDQAPTARIDSAVVGIHNITLADAAGDSGTLKINSSVVNSVNNFVIGDGGSGVVTMDTSVVNQSNNSTIGNQAGSTGDVTVRISVWNAGGAGTFLRVGDAGSGTLTLRDSVALNSSMFDVGRQVGSTGTVDIGDQSILNTADAFIGNSGSGSMDIHDGSIVATSGNAVIGNIASGSGLVTVRGEDPTGAFQSTWNVSGNLTVGDAGQGGFEVHNGAQSTITGNVRIGRQAGSIGTILVEGVGAVSRDGFDVKR